MSATATKSHFAANLAALGDRNRDLAALLGTRRISPDLQVSDTTQGVAAGVYRGRQLCSRHRPMDEAERLVADLDLVQNATIVVNGFGMGYHVKQLAGRFGRAGLIVVFEPDLDLLRSVFELVDHSSWMQDALLLFITDPTDRGMLAQKLNGSESVLAQGVAFLDHPASRRRIGEDANRFGSMFSDYIATAKLTLMTTLVRSVDTIRNLLLNVDHYAAGAGIADLENIAAGHPAVVVSAGPSLWRNIHHLGEEGVRDRCVIVAVQTTLKPLLQAGIKPHFVTALDYHEISKRFYEDLPVDELGDVTLIADPKAHPVIIDSFPGPVRCCEVPFLNKLLGGLAPGLGALPAGATVAHLAVYVARFLGCNPIALIGQDLGFTDGLYYAPGTAIHKVWGPELNSFNTIAMMEWQRIVRHRVHLEKTRDVNGRPIFTDAQMVNYLHQFERDFGQYEREGGLIIDATEGGVVKQHTTAMPLKQVLERHATRPLPAIPLPDRGLDPARLQAAASRIAQVRRDIAVIREASAKTSNLLRKMLEDQQNESMMKRHFRKLQQHRGDVERRMEAFDLLNHLNQLGVFKRMKADRRLHMQQAMSPLEYQRGQIERDLENVIWSRDAAEEMVDQLARAEKLLRGEQVSARARPLKVSETEGQEPRPIKPHRICALVPVDPTRNGLGIERSLAADFHGGNVLQSTVARLGRLGGIESIILICPEDFDVEFLIDRNAIGRKVEIERCDGTPFGPEHKAIAAARLWAQNSWRGGVAGMCVYDEVLCPQVMNRIMQQRDITAALLAAPDWPLIDISEETGCQAIINRHLEHPDQLSLVFTQAPPGLSACLVSASLMGQLAERSRLSTVGAALVYQPHAPQGDPIARDANVQIDHSARNSLIRATYDSSHNRQLIDNALHGDAANLGTSGIVAKLEAERNRQVGNMPRQLIIELTTRRNGNGVFARHPFGNITRPDMTPELAGLIFDQFRDIDDWVVSFQGFGDPLLHESLADLVRSARAAGARGVHVRTDLLADDAALDRLMSCGIDILSIDLHADRAATYQAMMGTDRFKEVLFAIEHVLNRRELLTDKGATGAIGLPWLVPHLQRRAETYEDIESFFDRWQGMLGAAVIEPPPAWDRQRGLPEDSLMPAFDTSEVMWEKLRNRMTIFSNGTAPVSELDLPGGEAAGNVADTAVHELWRIVSERRLDIRNADGPDAEALRTFRP